MEYIHINTMVIAAVCKRATGKDNSGVHGWTNSYTKCGMQGNMTQTRNERISNTCLIGVKLGGLLS